MNYINMKHLHILVVIAIVSIFSSCIADLDEYNPSGTTADNIFSTESGHTGLVNLCYSQLRKEFYGRENALLLSMMGTDIWHESRNRNDYSPTSYYSSRMSAENVGLIKNSFERFYIPINYCNAAIERADAAEYSNNTTRQQRVAEAKFLRAFYYWHIVENWGGVELKLTETKTAINTSERSSVSDFYNLCILPDLEFAAANLPVTQTEHGRATKAAAQGMLARMYLTWASHLKYQYNNSASADEFYRKAKAAADSVILDPGAYNVSLYNTSAEVFDYRNNKSNSEAMFFVSHSTLDGLNPQARANRLCSYFIADYDFGMGVLKDAENGYSDAFLIPTKYLLDLYDETKDARYSAYFKDVWYCNDTSAYNKYWTTTNVRLFGKDSTVFLAGSDVPERFKTKLEFSVGDTVMYFTKKAIPNKATVKYAVRDINDIYYTSGDSVGCFKLPMSSGRNFVPQLMKYHDPIYPIATAPGTGRLDVIMMRFAEMYLIAAEAQFHISNDNYDATAIAYINELRDRAAIGGAGTFNVSNAEIDASGMGAGGFLNFILDERARELCGEHLRFYDLSRTRQLENRLGLGKANPNITEFDKTKHYLRPVPVSFLQSINNGAEFGQNTGY